MPVTGFIQCDDTSTLLTIVGQLPMSHDCSQIVEVDHNMSDHQWDPFRIITMLSDIVNQGFTGQVSIDITP